MKRLAVTVLLLSCLAAAGADVAAAPAPAETAPASDAGLRNPFWPIGYEGKRETITAEVRVAPRSKDDVEKELAAKKAAEAAAEEAEKTKRDAAAAAARKAAEEAEKARIVTDEHWRAARAALRFGGRVKVRSEDGAEERSSVMINGNTYADGDLVSFNHGRNRFTWRVSGLTAGQKLRLERVRYRNLDETKTRDKAEKGKGE